MDPMTIGRARFVIAHGGATLPAVLLCGLGLLLSFPTMLEHGFAHVPGDIGDARLVHYLLEHSYRWVAGDSRHPLWDPPFFYPTRNAGAYSDMLLGVAPLYWLWRLAQVQPGAAYLLWFLLCSALNFVAAYLLLWRRLGLAPLAAAVGAYVFAFGNSRGSQLLHAQLVPQFLTISALAALLALFAARKDAEPRRARRRDWAWIAVYFGAVVGQLYAAFYYGAFLLLGLVVAAAWALVLSGPRRRLLAVLRRHRLPLAVSTVGAALAMLPWLGHYLAAARGLPPRPFVDVERWLPRLQSWFFLGERNRLYGWTADLGVFTGFEFDVEHQLGLGPVTTVAAVLGLVWAVRGWATGSGFARLLILVTATLMLVATSWPSGVSAWEIVYAVLPGAEALRSVARIGLLLLIPAAVGVAASVQRAQVHLPRLAVAALCVGIVAEQSRDPYTFDQQQVRAENRALVAAIDPACPAFLYSPVTVGPTPAFKHHLDAMWAGLERGVPTVNGYSGNFPLDWGFFDPTIQDAEDERRLDEALRRWEERHDLTDQVCWIKLSEAGGRVLTDQSPAVE